MEARERELAEETRRLGESALACRRAGDVASARARVVERRRALKRLEKLRGGLGLVDSQLDAIKTSELDKEIMLTLRASTTAMKKAGIGIAITEAESMMGELDENMRDIQDVNRVLAAPLADDEDDLDKELDWLEETPLLERDTKPPIAQRARLEEPPNTMARLEPVAE